MIESPLRRSALLLLLGLAACGRRGGGGGEPEVAPSGLSYGVPSARLVLLVDAPVNAPTVTGRVESWSIEPALPPGMLLDPATGNVHGRPQALQPSQSYTVSASNSIGSTSTQIAIGVFRAPHFAYVANEQDGSLSMFVVDAHSGRLIPNGHLPARPGEVRPTILRARPDGRFLYVANQGDVFEPSSLSMLAIRPEDGRLAPRAPTPLTGGPLDFAIAADGRHLYATVFGTDELVLFALDPDLGTPTWLGSLPTGDGPSALALDPSGAHLYVLHSRAGTISTFAVGSGGASLVPGAPDVFVGGSPSSIAVAPAGGSLYVTFEDSGRLVAFATDPTSGEPSPMGEIDTGDRPTDVALHPGGRFAYVSDSGSGTLSLFAFEEGGGGLAPHGEAPAGDQPVFVAFDESGLYAYSVSRGSNEVWAYSIGQGDGSLSRVGIARTRGVPGSITLVVGTTPIRKEASHVFVLAHGSGEVDALRVNEASGGLQEIGSPVPAGADPRDLVVDPLGRWAASVDYQGASLSVHWIDPTSGALSTAWSGEPLPGRPRGVDVDPTGDFVYVAMRDPDRAMSFAIDELTGRPTAVSSVATFEHPQSANIHPSGRFLYVTHTFSDDIWAWPVVDGVIQNSPKITTGPGNPLEVRFSPGGDLAVTPLDLSDHIATYAIDPHDGRLSVVLPGKAARNSPQAFEVHPSGRFAYAAIHGGHTQEGRIASYRFDEQTARITDEVSHFDSLHPRDLRVDPSGRYLFSADEGTDTVSSFAIDPASGRPSLIGRTPAGVRPRALAILPRLRAELLP